MMRNLMDRIFIRPDLFQIFCYRLLFKHKIKGQSSVNIFYDQSVYLKSKKSDGYASMFAKDIIHYITKHSLGYNIKDSKIWTEENPVGKMLAIFYRDTITDDIIIPRGVKNVIIVCKDARTVKPIIDTTDLIPIPFYDIINNQNSPFRLSYFMKKANGTLIPVIYRIGFFFPIN
jgi:hypothetical protein